MDWIPVKEAAGLLGYHPSHIRRLCAHGRLSAVKHAGQWYILRSCVSGGTPGEAEAEKSSEIYWDPVFAHPDDPEGVSATTPEPKLAEK